MGLRDRLPALGYGNYTTYLVGGFVSNVGNRVQDWAILWHLYQITHRSDMVGLVGLVRVVPLIFFSLVGGVIADQIDRRKILLVTQTGLAFVAVGLAYLEYIHINSATWLYVMVGLGAVARAFDGPARQSMVVNLVPRSVLPNALGLNGISWRLSDVLGPVILGILIASRSMFGLTGLAWAYLFNFITFFAVLYSIWRLPSNVAFDENHEKVRSLRQAVDSIVEGLHFVREAKVLSSAMWIDWWATFLSGAEALLPAFAAAILKLDSRGYGYLAASSATGALIAAAAMTIMPTIRRQGLWVVLMIGCYGLSTVLFGLSPNLYSAAVFLACTGAADMISTVLRQTIRQLATPDRLRGRMNATSSIFHISGPQLGDYEAGLLARFIGERGSIVSGGVACLFVALHWLRSPGLRDYEHGDEDSLPA